MSILVMAQLQNALEPIVFNDEELPNETRERFLHRSKHLL